MAYYRDMVTIIRDRIKDMIDREMTLEEVKAAKPTADYEPRYGAHPARGRPTRSSRPSTTSLGGGTPAGAARATRRRTAGASARALTLDSTWTPCAR